MSREQKAEDYKKPPSNLVTLHSFGSKVLKADSDPDTKLGVDPFKDLYSQKKDDRKVIKPTYDLYQLCKLREASDILVQCVQAMSVNVDGFGYELKRTDDPEDTETELPAEAVKEKELLEQFLGFINDRQNLTMLRMETREDLESCGMAYWEVVRTMDRTTIAELHLLPAHSMRLVEVDKDFTEYTQKIRIGKVLKDVIRKRKFGRFVQNTEDNKIIWFKEFGDPREIGSEDGKDRGKGKNASEVICFKIFAPHSRYGLPRWIGVLLKVMGSRKSDEVNYLFFDNKTIPPLIITVSGGALTEEAMEGLKNVFNDELKGVENFHKALVLEALPSTAGDVTGERTTPVRIEVKPLTQFIEKDATFMEYNKNNRSVIRSAFRLPPIYTGDSTDYTRATALESARVTEEQVFDPERKGFDYIFNRTILPSLGINYWKLKSLGAKTSDDTKIVTAMGMVKEALPVGVLQESVADMRSVPKGKIDKSLYTITLGQHLAEASKPEEPTDDKLGPSKAPDDKPVVKLDAFTIQKIAKEIEKVIDMKITVGQM